MNQLIESLRSVVGREALLSEPNELIVYECDGLPQHKYLPRAVVFPKSTEETAEVLRVLGKAGVAFTPRGAGTGLSGGALALEQAVVIELARMRRILRIDEANAVAVVQTGVVNSHVTRAVSSLNLRYVPDPSSQPTCTIGGNIAENAGGVHCLKYGTTTDHVLGIRVVLAGGEVVDLGGTSEQPGYDLRGVFIGSEGTFGIATEATLRLVPAPPTVRTLLAEFAEVTDASHAVSAIIAAGIIPAGLEMMDREIIRAVEASVFAAGLPPDAGAALLIELDGLAAGIDEDAEKVTAICVAHGARNCRLARDENERKKLWAARKGAFGAIGRIAPDSMIQDAVVPRSRLPQIMADAYNIASKYQLRIANVFHAGDGNLHPLICFDSRSADEVKRVKEAGRELMEICVRAGGSITGEHGVGLDKRELLPLIFSDDDMEAMLRVRAAFDPSGLMNPGKIIPVLRGCGEGRAVASASVPAANLEQARKEQSTAAIARPDDVEQRHTTTIRHNDFKEDEAHRRLVQIVGVHHVSGTEFPSSNTNVLTVSPASIDEASQVIRLASSERWSIVPAGAGSWLAAGSPIEPVHLVISTLRLNKIKYHEPADLVAIVEAGAKFNDFNTELAKNGQWLPLDAPGCSGSTVGGIVATGVSGPHTCGYGPPRAFVIGLKVILPGGKLIKVGGRVVKNVAGYDLCKLFTGSYGTLGLIIEANFKLRPRPEREITVAASGPVRPLISAAHLMLRAPLFPMALELVSPRKAKQLGIETEQAPAVLLARFAGNDKTVAAQADAALSLLASARVSEACSVYDDAEIWRTLAAYVPSTHNQISWSARVPRSEVQSLMTVIHEKYPSLFDSTWHVAIADGIIRMIQTYDGAADTRSVQELRRGCEQLGGSLILEDSPLHLKQAVGTWGDLAQSRTLMHRIKKQIDPGNIFSPGRFA